MLYTYKNIIKIITATLCLIGLAANSSFAITDTCFVLEINRTIISGNDDVEESATGNMYMESTDLELVNDGNNGNQIVGLRFTNLSLLQGVEIQEAYLHFTSDEETSSDFSSLNISLEDTDDAAPFSEINFNVSSRPRSSASVQWIAGTWTTPWVKTEKHKTPDLKNLVQEIVNRPGWQSGNDLAFIISGIGTRSAISYELDPTMTAQLVIKVASPPVPTTLLENIYLNEIMPSNNRITDNFGETDDWIEIYNGSNQSLYLGSLYLTDDMDSLQKWQVTSSPLIEPNGHAIIWADDDPEQGGNHTNFKLKSDGEFLALVQELNGTLYILDSLTFPATPENISYGRLQDGQNEWVFFAEASPNASNNGQPQLLNETVNFSLLGGHYPSALTLELSVNDPTASIYYTLDGSTPTDQSTLYQSPISINQTTSINAKALKSGYVSLTVQSEFYIINEPSQLPILNVQSDPNNFWSDEDGIYVQGTNGRTLWCNNVSNNWNQDWERPCQLTFFEPDGSLGFQINAGMKIGGACSRNLKQKTLNLFMRNNQYGDELIDYPIFPNQDFTEYRRFKIRNGGTDWIEMLFRDGMNHLVLDKTVDLDLMAYRPVRVYINGEFWGISGAREMFNKYYIESHHGVDPDNIDLLSDPYGNGNFVREGDFQRYDEMINFVNNNPIVNNSNYEIIKDFIDLPQYINYHIAQVYLANYDWPANNVRIWRDRDGGKFRWMLFDTDASTGFINWGEEVATAEHNTIQHALNNQNNGIWPNPPGSTYLFRQMMSNEQFRNEYIQRTCTFRELIFAPERVHSMVDSLQNLLAPEMNRHLAHWLENEDLGEGMPSGGSMEEWQLNVQRYKNFFTQRAVFIPENFQTYFNLDGRYDLSFGYDETTTGNILIHENDMPIPFNYEGEYFQNMPIKIKAIPHDGFYFSHWLETGVTDAEINFVASSNQTLTPIFTTEEPVTTEEINPKFQVNIYPNPMQDLLMIELPDLENKVSLSFYNIIGIKFLQKEVSQINTTINTAQLPTGIYLVKLETPKGSVTKRILKN